MLFLCLCRKFHTKIQVENVEKMNTGCTYAHFPKCNMLLHCSVFCSYDFDHIIDTRWVKTVSYSNFFIWIWHNLVSLVTKVSRKWFYFLKTTHLCWFCCHAVETPVVTCGGIHLTPAGSWLATSTEQHRKVYCIYKWRMSFNAKRGILNAWAEQFDWTESQTTLNSY